MVVDIGLAAVPILMIGNTGPHDSLIKQKPTRHLLSFLPLFSVISFLFFQTMCYIGVWFYVQAQDWFEPYQFVAGLWPPNSSYEQTNIFLLSCAAATIAAIVFSKGAPYRKPLYTNKIMGLWTIAAVAVTIFMSFYDTEDFRTRLNMKIAPSYEYKLVFLFVMIGNFLFCYIWEVFNYFIIYCGIFKLLLFKLDLPLGWGSFRKSSSLVQTHHPRSAFAFRASGRRTQNEARMASGRKLQEQRDENRYGFSKFVEQNA